jgi:hypothetical protein
MVDILDGFRNGIRDDGQTQITLIQAVPGISRRPGIGADTAGTQSWWLTVDVVHILWQVLGFVPDFCLPRVHQTRCGSAPVAARNAGRVIGQWVRTKR